MPSLNKPPLKPIYWPALIGSAPSAGTTLLSLMLDSHPEVSCGPELTILGHPVLYRDFQKFREDLKDTNFLKGFSDRDALEKFIDGWVPYALIYEGNLNYYQIDFEKLTSIIEQSNDASDFIYNISGDDPATRNKRLFVEKSPSNIYGMRQFLDFFPGGRGICLVRNPLDQIASLKRRGFSFGRALSIWLVETAMCLELNKSSRIKLMRYEDLIKDPKARCDEIQDFLNVSMRTYEMLNYRQGSGRLMLDSSINVVGWLSRPADGLVDSSIGRGHSELTQEEIFALHHAQIVSNSTPLAFCHGRGVATISSMLGYLLPPCPAITWKRALPFLASEMLLTSGSAVIRRTWFHERFVECRAEKVDASELSLWEIAHEVAQAINLRVRRDSEARE